MWAGFKRGPVLLSEFFWGGGWLPFRHVIAVWKVCFTLFISALAKLGVFYTLTHFGMEKHEKKKVDVVACDMAFIPRGWLWVKEKGEKEMLHLPCEECNRTSTPFKNFYCGLRKCNGQLSAGGLWKQKLLFTERTGRDWKVTRREYGIFSGAEVTQRYNWKKSCGLKK